MNVFRLGTAVLALLVSTSALAQGPNSLEFSFSSPGARAMGLGGAFIALADDATAAFANPAGLFQLVEPEFSLEGRSFSYETPFTMGGRAAGPPTGLGIDTMAGLRTGVSSDNLKAVSFLSFVRPSDRWSLALYRHKLAKFEASSATNGLFSGPPGNVDRNEDALVDTRLDFVSYGLSMAFRATDALSFGLGISYVEGELVLRTEEFLPDDDGQGGLFGPTSYLPERLVVTNDFGTDSTDWTVLGGFLWRASERVSLGGVYRQGPGFNGGVVATVGPAFDDPGIPPGSVLRQSTPIEFPDVFGLGLAARSRNRALTLGLDWVRVEYSTILDKLNPELFDDLPVIDDVDEVHAGIEYVFSQATPIVAIRFGAWLDPDHRLRAPSDEPEPFDVALFRPGDDELHLAAGVGLVFRTLQLDAGFDLSDRVDTLSISLIRKF